MRQLILVTILMLIVSCNKTKTIISDAKDKNEISFYTTDSLKIYGDLYETSKDANTIILFHQGGSNARAEYHTIIPRLSTMGYNVLAVDLFLGGQRYGSSNRSIANVSLTDYTNPTSYCDDYENLEATLSFVKQLNYKGKIILCLLFLFLHL